MTLSQLTRQVREVLKEVDTLRIKSDAYIGCCEIRLANEAAVDTAMTALRNAGLPCKKVGWFENLGYWLVGAARPEDYPHSAQ
ncbi:hypothetical protein RHDC4_02802 [Rhodocyclaceae bacterium]|nr:hypothetical protein RHDC4_02802 [Rhodocyclaceae bacterium]